MIEVSNTGPLACLWLLLAAPAAQEPTWSHAVLDRGVRMHVLHVPGAAWQTTFAILPDGLCTDARDRTQFAHLAEHAMIRGIDADGLQADGIHLNGETTADALRLDTSAPGEKWREGVVRPLRWLAVRGIDADVLHREKLRIAGEVDATEGGGMTHKWASAAYAQALLGATRVRVRGDVADASTEMLAADLAARVRIDDRLVLVTSGPAEPEAVRALVADELAAFPPDAKAAAVLTEPPDPGECEVRWDLAVRHWIVGYPLPATAGPLDRAAARALAMLIQQRAFLQPDLRRAGVRVQCQAGHRTAGRAAGHLVVSVALPDGTDREAVVAALDEVVAAVARRPGGALFALHALQAQLQLPADLASQVSDLPPAQRRWAVGNRVLGAVALSDWVGVPLGELAAVLGEVDADRVKAVAAEVLHPGRRHAVLLLP